MTHYSNKPSLVRVDYFKPTGKWYETLEVNMEGYYTYPDIKKALIFCLKSQYPSFTPEDWIIVCLDPYHQYSHPILIKE